MAYPRGSHRLSGGRDYKRVASGASHGRSGRPRNTVAPVVTGTATVGQTLSTSTGTWTGDATITYAYRWMRGSAPIGGATSNTYVLVAGDAGEAVSCVVTGTNAKGSAAASSNGVSVAAGGGGDAPVNTVAPAVTGTATVGQTLTTTDGTWTGDATISFTYQWQHGTTNISGATAGTYVIEVAYVGETIRCVVTGTNDTGNASANSNATAAVINTYQATVLADSPTHYWRLAETSGTNADDLGSGADDGTYTGTYTLAATSLLTTDTANKALSLPSAAGYVTVDAAGPVVNTTAWSVEFWVNGSAQASKALWSERQNASAASVIWIGTGASNTAKLLLWFRDVGNNIRLNNLESTATILDGNPHHVVYAEGAGVYQVYIDGVADISGTYVASSGWTVDMATIGALRGSAISAHFTGTIDEFATYSTKLSLARVQAHYAAR